MVFYAFAQDNLYTSYTTVKAREKLFNNLNRSINANLSLPLNDSTEEKWQEAFWALELLQLTSPQLDKKISSGFDSILHRSEDFQKALTGLAYSNYPAKFTSQVSHLLQAAPNPKVFAICAEYLLRNNHDDTLLNSITHLIENNFPNDLEHPVFIMLRQKMTSINARGDDFLNTKKLGQILDKQFLPGQIVMYSFQRANRDFPGLVVVRNPEGKFVKDSTNNLFCVPQLARSITNLPSYITNGNTPQGIFRLKGFGVSMNSFIGPTANIQMLLPVEDGAKHFFNDSTLLDTVWSVEKYEQLLPKSLKDFKPLYESYYAGLAGRTEIIAHGTTINPEYYTGKTYYPHTPSLGCLCTKEIWNGKRLESDQQKLVQAMLSAGGANGYCVVIELNDEQRAVSAEDIFALISKAESSK